MLWQIPIRLSNDTYRDITCEPKKSLSDWTESFGFNTRLDQFKDIFKMGWSSCHQIQLDHTYLVDINGVRKHMHADKLRKYHI